MSLYLSVGDQLLTPDEIHEKTITGEIERIKARSKKVSLLGFPGGEKAKFTPIGLGKPLSIEIREIYTGELPASAWYEFRDTKDLLVTTSHKPITQQAAASRAVNMLREKIAPETHIKDVAAISVGTPIIYYSPAFVESSISVTVELGFENFSKQILTTLAGAFKSAASIPLFATRSMYLLAGSMITALLADLGKAIFEKGPEYIGTDSINFERAGIKNTVAGYGVLFSDDAPEHISQVYNVNSSGELVHIQSATKYSEKFPYVIVSIDGAENTSYKNFAQSTASAELLARFYNAGENSTQPVDELLKGLQYYNDIEFLRKAVSLQEQISQFKGEATELEKLKIKHKALLDNIMTEELKLKV